MFLYSTLSLYSQSYRYDFKDSVSHIYLEIAQNKYEIGYSKQLSIDIFMSAAISSGTCIQDDSLLILKDGKAGFEMIFRKDSNELVPFRKYPIFFENKRLGLFCKVGGLESDYLPKIDSDKEDTIYSISVDNIKCGKYSNRKLMTISIMDDWRYAIEGEVFSISEGKWSENGDKIELYDEYLKYTFVGTKLDNNRIRIELPESKRDIFYLR